MPELQRFGRVSVCSAHAEVIPSSQKSMISVSGLLRTRGGDPIADNAHYVRKGLLRTRGGDPSISAMGLQVSRSAPHTRR